MTRDNEQSLVGFEITEIPRAYVESVHLSEGSQSTPWTLKSTNLQYERFLNSVLYTGINFAFRIESKGGNGKLLYLMQQTDTNMFEPIYSAFFQDFNIKQFEQPRLGTFDGPIHVCTITGVPKSSTKILDAMSEIITKFSGHAIYQVYSISASPSRIKRTVSKHRLKMALEKSQKQQKSSKKTPKPTTREKSKSKSRESKKSTPKPREKTTTKTPSMKKRKERLSPKVASPKADSRGEKRKVNMPAPEVRGKPIESFKALRSKVEKEYPGLSRNPRFGEWMRDAEHYMNLHDTRMKYPEMPPEALREMSREMGVPRTKAEGWIHQGKEPRLFKYTREVMTKTEGLERVREIKSSLNGAETLQDMKEKLDNFYLRPELENLPGYQMHHENAKSFYKLLDSMKAGGLNKDLARDVGTNRRNVERWMKGELPRIPRIASEVPQEDPKPGHKWLPSKIVGKKFTEFIEVKEKVESFDDIERFLDQLKSLDSTEMKALRKRFRDVSKEKALMYNLGIAVSDGSFYRNSMTERFGLELSKKYDWSENVGEATRYHWGLLGIRSGRIADHTSEYKWNGETRSSERMGWTSEATPLMNWLKRSALGFELEHSKSRLDADWIPNAPKEAKSAFIQGVADGDGWVSSMKTGISTNREAEFYSGILGSLGIHSTPGNKRSQINRSKDIQNAAELPLFKHASGRQEKLENLSDMYRASPNAGRMNENEKMLIQELTNQGHSTGEIREKIWGDLGISRSKATIWRYQKKLESRNSG
ncbi:MAG: hypothetical protein E3J86_00315 [Candidatus Thorarchaeota archaeon]|nr:MAG: hypothetical protein E3J86_00315 [Candidatus Thorarchaeota archaeon]